MRTTNIRDAQASCCAMIQSMERELMDAAISRAWEGDFAALRAALPQVTPGAATALRAVVWHADGKGELPTLDEIEAQSDDGWGATAARFVARAKLLAFDTIGLRRALALQARLASTPQERCWAQVNDAWVSIVEGKDPLLELERVATEASQMRVAPLALEVAVLRALRALEFGTLDDALRLARRASRMARTESLPQQEYLANVVLARVRRHVGYSHLAVRILAALQAVAPSPWHRWLGSESALAGHGGAGVELLSAASLSGKGFDEAAQSLLDNTFPSLGARREVRALIDAFDPRRPVEGLDASVGAWAKGQAPSMPFGLHSVVIGTPNSLANVPGHSWVFVQPNAPARRFLHPGLGLLPDVPRLEHGTKRHGRSEKAVAVLALAVGRVAVRDFVQAVYEFQYQPRTHDGVLRVLLHRVRKMLGEHASVERVGDDYILECHRPFVVPDPRTAATLGDRLLRVMASERGASARKAAQALGVPLRTVQEELQRLVEDGACEASKSGRQVAYVLDDTTFAEPTRA